MTLTYESINQNKTFIPCLASTTITVFRAQLNYYYSLPVWAIYSFSPYIITHLAKENEKLSCLAIYL